MDGAIDIAVSVALAGALAAGDMRGTWREGCPRTLRYDL